MKKILAILTLIALIVVACRKDNIEFTPTKTTTVHVDSLSTTAYIQDNDKLFLDATTIGAINYEWNTGQTGNIPIIEVGAVDSTYSVTVTTADTVYQYSIYVIYSGNTFFVPNVFTPNDDGTNDVFGPVGTNIDLNKYLMKIYNSDLKCIYSTRDFSKPWNGCINNDRSKRCPSGYYYYYIKYTGIDGVDKTKSGIVEKMPG